jgi:hypothetical protein
MIHPVHAGVGRPHQAVLGNTFGNSQVLVERKLSSRQQSETVPSRVYPRDGHLEISDGRRSSQVEGADFKAV